MRLYGRIETNFWQNMKVRQLSERGQRLLIYLYACPHGNSVGCFILPTGYIMADLDWSSEQVFESLSEALSKGFIERDDKTGLTRVIGWFGHNSFENKNVAKGAVKIISALPNGKIRVNLINELLATKNPFMAEFESALKELRKSFEPPEPEPEPINAVANATDAGASGGTLLDLKAEVWKRARALLAKHDIPDKHAGSLIGKWLKALGPPDSETQLLHILAGAEVNCHGDLIEYVTAAIQRRGQNGKRTEHRNGWAEAIAEGGV